jgi:hypothetical protein
MDIFTLIHRMKWHIELENCHHCKSILNSDDENGIHPAPSKVTTATPTPATVSKPQKKVPDI